MMKTTSTCHFLQLLFISTLIFPSNLYSQVINAYAKVTAISGTTLTLSNVNQTAHSFAVGSHVVIMQMQDDVIGSNTTNASTFGDLSAIGSAGLYEIRRITDIDGNSTDGYTSATPTNITLDVINNTYNTGTNSSVQIISFRQMSTTNYTTTGNISALAWDGNIGGVVAMYVPGTLTLSHNISANALGFRGGTRSNNNSGSVCVAANMSLYRANDPNCGYKGEGIYKNTNNTYNNQRAKILNGGGGGVHHNSGGGGGGNYTAGGNGGNGYNNCTTNPAPGIGGIALSAYISADRIFMGGGGGGGQQNNTQGRNGGNGGGIILIKATEITTSCGSSVSITANGTGPATNGTNDGGGGGGAAGSIVFWVDTWNVSASCPLTITANGGNGSTSNDGAAHAGGGAGAQGVVIFNGAQPTTNVTTQTNNGNPGCNNSSSPCTNPAGSASGTNGSGIITGAGTGNPMPVELVFFRATKLSENAALLDWATASETNNSHFSLYKSIDGLNWEKLTDIPGKGNSNAYNSYEFTDFNLLQGTNYYKLTQTDFDGTTKNHGIRFIEADINSDFYIYPNPFDGLINISSNNNISSITILSAEGKTIKTLTGINSNVCSISTDDLATGIYFIRINNDFGKNYFNKIIKY
jgi:hypothetical protein